MALLVEVSRGEPRTRHSGKSRQFFSTSPLPSFILESSQEGCPVIEIYEYALSIFNEQLHTNFSPENTKLILYRRDIHHWEAQEDILFYKLRHAFALPRNTTVVSSMTTLIQTTRRSSYGTISGRNLSLITLPGSAVRCIQSGSADTGRRGVQEEILKHDRNNHDNIAVFSHRQAVLKISMIIRNGWKTLRRGSPISGYVRSDCHWQLH